MSIKSDSFTIFDASKNSEVVEQVKPGQKMPLIPSLKLSNPLHWAKDRHDCSSPSLLSARPMTPLSEINLSADDLICQRRMRSFLQNVRNATDHDTLYTAFETCPHSNSQISNWIHSGYESLNILLQKPKEYPWMQISALSNPQVMEQLIILQSILEKPPYEKMSQEVDFILKYALSIAAEKKEGYEEIGKLLFVADKNPKGLLEQSFFWRGREFVDWINKSLFHEFHRIKIELKNHYEAHTKTGIQPADLAIKVLLTKEISQLLLTQEGYLNAGLIGLIESTFVDPAVKDVQVDVELVSKLGMLQRCPHIRNSFFTIGIPSSPKSSASTLIHSTLETTQQISKNETILSALTAYLSHLRQGPAGSCFTTSLAINMLAARPEECIKDFNALLTENALTRTVDGIKIQFPFLLNAFDEYINKKIKVDGYGKIIQESEKTAYLWEAPGLIAAGKAMGVSNLKSVLLALLNQNIKKSQKYVELSPDFIIHAMAYSSEMHQRGVLAFESQVGNPLLHAWENSIAGMADSTESGAIKLAIINTTLSALIPQLNYSKHLVDSFYANLNSELNKSVRLQYDPTAGSEKKGRDNRSNFGGFVLYDRNDSNKITEWIRVDSPQAYQKFILKQSLKAAEKLPQTEGLKESLEVEILSNKFLNYAIRSMHHRNQSLSNPLDSINELKHTPWMVLGGNNPKKILKIYLELDQLPTTEKFLPVNAQHLLEKVIELGKNSSHKPGELKNPYLITPVRTPGIHSFSLMLGHPTLMHAWEKDVDSGQWMQNSVIEPGLQIANSMADTQLKTKLIDYCIKNFFVGRNSQHFLNRYLNFPADLTIQEFRNHLSSALSDSLPSSKKIFSKRERLIDTEIYHLLPTEKQNILENSAVHFADTNWYEGIHDVHFCFVVNPGTGKLEIWEVSDDGKQLDAADQSWLSDHEWEIYEPFFLEKEHIDTQTIS